jgi:transposase
MPGNGKNAEQWSSAHKFAAVLETATLNGAESALYWRKKGLFVEQIAAWQNVCLDANANVSAHEKGFQDAATKDRQQINA